MWLLTELPDGERDMAFHLKAILESLSAVWARLMKAYPLPPLYQAGIRYREEPNLGSGLEEVAMPWRCYKRRWGDCDDLVCYRVAELRARGEQATVQVLRRRGTRNFHVTVRRASGAVEDPAVRCGAPPPNPRELS